MNTPTLRPPWPMYRFLAVPLAALIGYGIFQVWGILIPTLERVYLADYLKSSLPEISIPNPLEFGAKPKAKRPEMHVLMCYVVGGDPRPATELVSGLELKPVALRMTRADFSTWLRRNIYGDREPMMVLVIPIVACFLMFPVLFGIGWRLDQKRHIAFRNYRWLLKGPETVTPRQFAKRVKGDGLAINLAGIQSLRVERFLGAATRPSVWSRAILNRVFGTKAIRIERGIEMATARLSVTSKAIGNRLFGKQSIRIERQLEAVAERLSVRTKAVGNRLVGNRSIRIESHLETQHIVTVGDQGSGKTQGILGLADQFERNEETVVVYDPHHEFLKRYHDPSRGDVILGLDDRAAAWSPSDEIEWSSDYTARATSRAQAESLYPGHPGRRDWFFTSVCRDIHDHVVVNYRPTAAEMAGLYERPDPLIDAAVEGSPLQETLAKNNSGTRASIIGSLTNNIVPMLKQIKTPTSGCKGWSAREWVKRRQGWIFLTSSQNTRVASGPLQRMWIDSIIRGILAMGPQPNLPRVRLILDELWTLGELSQLTSAMSESRKSGLTIILGFQGRAQVREIYGESAESIFSAPYMKVILRTGEPESGEWAAKMLGRGEYGHVRETRGHDGKHSYTADAREEWSVFPSELAGLKNRCGYLRYGSFIVPIKIALVPARAERAVGWVPRAGSAPVILPMPSLEKIEAQEQQERSEKARQFALGNVAKPESGSPFAPRRGGPPKPSGLWTQGDS